MKKNDIYIVAGESSGDLHGSEVLKQLKKIDPSISFKGIGGDKMIAEGLTPLFHIKSLGMMGFWEVIKHIFVIKKIFKSLFQNIIKDKPAVILLIDFSEFNLKFSEYLRKKNVNIKIIRYVSPQIWASRSKRIKRVVDTYDCLCCILPFEKQIYTNYDKKFDCRFVGNPLIEQIDVRYSKEDFCKKFNIPKQNKIISILPGSRIQEVSYHLKILLDYIRIIKKTNPTYSFVLCKSNNIDLQKYNDELNKLSIIEISSNFAWDVMSHSDLILCKSGTATLQAALCETPTIIFYRMHPLTYAIGKRIVKIKFIGLPNIITQKEVFPELIQDDFNTEKLIYLTYNFLNNEKKYNSVKNELKEIKNILGKEKSSEKVAQAVYEFYQKT